MKCFLISYELDPDKNYAKLILRLRQLGAFGILPTQWALKAPLTAAQIRDDLAAFIEPSDRLSVAQTTSVAYQRLVNADKLREIVA
jgi:hypothetical protein